MLLYELPYNVRIYIAFPTVEGCIGLVLIQASHSPTLPLSRVRSLRAFLGPNFILKPGVGIALVGK